MEIIKDKTNLNDIRKSFLIYTLVKVVKKVKHKEKKILFNCKIKEIF